MGDLGEASGKPDTLAAEFTGLFSEVSRTHSFAMPGSVSSQITKVVAVSSVTLHNGAGRGNQLAGVLESLGGDSWLLHHRINFKEWPSASDSALKVASPGEPHPSVY